jgi:hypothetical protein
MRQLKWQRCELSQAPNRPRRFFGIVFPRRSFDEIELNPRAMLNSTSNPTVLHPAAALPKAATRTAQIGPKPLSYRL